MNYKIEDFADSAIICTINKLSLKSTNLIATIKSLKTTKKQPNLPLLDPSYCFKSTILGKILDKSNLFLINSRFNLNGSVERRFSLCFFQNSMKFSLFVKIKS